MYIKSSYLVALYRVYKKLTFRHNLQLVVLEHKIVFAHLLPRANIKIDIRTALIGLRLHDRFGTRHASEPNLQFLVVPPVAIVPAIIGQLKSLEQSNRPNTALLNKAMFCEIIEKKWMIKQNSNLQLNGSWTLQRIAGHSVEYIKQSLVQEQAHFIRWRWKWRSDHVTVGNMKFGFTTKSCVGKRWSECGVQYTILHSVRRDKCDKETAAADLRFSRDLLGWTKIKTQRGQVGTKR